MEKTDRINRQQINSLRHTIEQDKAEIRLMEIKIKKFNEHISEVSAYIEKLEKL
jgi:hypothetical protein